MPGKRDHSRRLITHARRMRKEPTDAEKKLWSLLRRGQINGLHFRQQVPIAGYIVDFCCLQEGIGVEADGGQHLDRKNVEYDNRRSETLTAVGIRILRFPDDEILRFPQNVQEAIFQAAFEKPPPQPSPGIPGAGE
jgi:very-short-patch-repair endonuclease